MKGIGWSSSRKRTFKAGPICLCADVYDLAQLEPWIGSHQHLLDKATFEQLAYRDLITSVPGNGPLPDSYAFNYFDETVTATHFGIKLRFYEHVARLHQALV